MMASSRPSASHPRGGLRRYAGSAAWYSGPSREQQSGCAGRANSGCTSLDRRVTSCDGMTSSASADMGRRPTRRDPWRESMYCDNLRPEIISMMDATFTPSNVSSSRMRSASSGCVAMYRSHLCAAIAFASRDGRRRRAGLAAEVCCCVGDECQLRRCDLSRTFTSRLRPGDGETLTPSACRLRSLASRAVLSSDCACSEDVVASSSSVELSRSLALRPRRRKPSAAGEEGSKGGAMIIS